MISIIDYGAGNIFSVKNALDYLGLDSILTSDINQIKDRAASISGQYKIGGAEIGVYIAVVD